MARWMRAIRSGAAGAAIALWAGAAIAAPVPQDGAQLASADSETPQDYDWIDRADALWDAIGDAPPDYSFAFDDGGSGGGSRGEPWAWETADGYWIVVEDGPDGMRSYYFEPNAEGPFLARAAQNSFGYTDGEVAMVYDAGGGALPQAQGAAYLDEGEALYDRGVRLRGAVRQRDWQPVNTTAWVDLSFVLIGLRHQWDEGRRRHAGWRRHRELPHVIAWHRRWDGEHRRRIDGAERFRRWREGGYQGRPPGRPGGWVHGPNRPGRDGWQAGRPGQRPPRRWTTPTGPQPSPTVVTRPGEPGNGAEGPARGPHPRGNSSDGPVVDPVAASRSERPGRGTWRGGERRPGRERPDGARPTPTPPVVTSTPAAQPPQPRPVFRSRPAADPSAPTSARPGRGRDAPGFTPPQRPAFPSPAAPAAAQPARPVFSPPPQRPASAPAPRPAAPRPAPPPRPAKVDRDFGKVD